MIKIQDKDIKNIYYQGNAIKGIYYKEQKIWPVENKLASITLNYAVGDDNYKYNGTSISIDYTIREEGNYEIDCEFIYAPVGAFNGRVFSQIQGENDNASWYVYSDVPEGGWRQLNIADGQKAILKMYVGFQFTNANQQLPSSFGTRDCFYSDENFVGTLTCNLLRVEKVTNTYPTDNATRYKPDELIYS